MGKLGKYVDDEEEEAEEEEEEEEEEDEEELVPVSKPSTKSSIRVLPEAGTGDVQQKAGLEQQFSQQVTEAPTSERHQTIQPLAQTESEILPPQEGGPGAPPAEVSWPKPEPEPVVVVAAQPPPPEPTPAPAPAPAPAPVPVKVEEPKPAPAPAPAPVQEQAKPKPQPQKEPEPPKPQPQKQPEPKAQPQKQPEPVKPKEPEPAKAKQPEPKPQPVKQPEPPKPEPPKPATPAPRAQDMETPIQLRYVPQVTAEPKPAAPPPTRTVLGESDWTNPEANPEHQPIRKVLPVGRIGKAWPPPEDSGPEREQYIGRVKVAGDDVWKKGDEVENLYAAAPWGGVRKGPKQWPPPEPEKVLVPYKSPVIDHPPDFRERPSDNQYQLPQYPSNAAALPAFQGQQHQVAPVAPQVPLPLAKRQQQQAPAPAPAPAAPAPGAKRGAPQQQQQQQVQVQQSSQKQVQVQQSSRQQVQVQQGGRQGQGQQAQQQQAAPQKGGAVPAAKQQRQR